MSTYFLLSFVVLALLLFFPVSKMIWVLSVRRLQNKTGSELSTAEIEGQRRRARVIALFLVLLFSYLFNLQLLGSAHG